MFNIFKKFKKNRIDDVSELFWNTFNKKITDSLTIEEIRSLYSDTGNKLLNIEYAKIISVRDNDELIQEDYDKLSGIRDKISFVKALDNANVILNASNGISGVDKDPFIKNFILDEEEIINKVCSTKSGSYFDIFCYVSSRIKNNKNYILPIIKKEGMVLKYLPLEYRDDDSVVLLAINCEKSPGNSLKYASDRLKSSKDFIIKALYNYGENFKYASDDLKNDVEFIYELINKYKMYGVLKCISDNVIISKKIISKIKEDRLLDIAEKCLCIFPEYFSDDRDFVLRAVQENGMLLEYASDKLKDDKEVVMAALKLKYIKRGSCVPLAYASRRLKKDREIARVAMKYAPLSYQVMDDSIKDEFSPNNN